MLASKANEKLKALDTACAHFLVHCQSTSHPDGTSSARWVCVECGLEFFPGVWSLPWDVQGKIILETLDGCRQVLVAPDPPPPFYEASWVPEVGGKPVYHATCKRRYKLQGRDGDGAWIYQEIQEPSGDSLRADVYGAGLAGYR